MSGAPARELYAALAEVEEIQIPSEESGAEENITKRMGEQVKCEKVEERSSASYSCYLTVDGAGSAMRMVDEY